MKARSALAWSLVLSGLVLVFVLDALLGISSELTPFEQVFLRIPGGALLGLGLVLLKARPTEPRLPFAVSALTWLTLGAIFGRAVGLIAVGGESPIQWAWLGLECVVVVLGALYLRANPPLA